MYTLLSLRSHASQLLAKDAQVYASNLNVELADWFQVDSFKCRDLERRVEEKP